MLSIIGSGIIFLLPLICFIIGFLRYYYVFEKFGIPSVFPLPIIGSYWQNIDKYPHENISEWSKTFGDIFGAFRGSQPTLHVLDPELITKILVKDSTNFSYRENNSGHITNEYTQNGLALLDYGKEYKIIRRLMEESLSPSPTNLENINSICLNMVQEINQTLKNQTHCVENRKFCIAWGIELCIKTFAGKSCKKESLSALLSHCKMATEEHTIGLFANLSYFYPKAFNWWQSLFSPEQGFNFVLNFVKEIYCRKINKIKEDSHTFLVKLINLRDARPDIKFVNDKMIIGQIVSNILSGYDIGNVLLSTLHVLAQRPQLQQTLRDEILKNLSIHDGKISYEFLNSLRELDACLKEVIRLYPSAYRLERMCKKDYKHNNITIKSGTCIVIPYLSLHYDSRYFVQHEIFNHERFLGSNDSTENLTSSNCYLPFGRGVRSCPAKSFVMTSLKLCLVHYLCHLEFSTNEAMPHLIPLKSTTSGNVLTDDFLSNIKQVNLPHGKQG